MKLSILIIDYAVSIDKPYLFAGRLLRQGGDNSLKAAVVQTPENHRQVRYLTSNIIAPAWDFDRVVSPVYDYLVLTSSALRKSSPICQIQATDKRSTFVWSVI